MQLSQGTLLHGGTYKIENVLGQGGFGITYLAKQSVSIEGPLGKINAEIEVTIKEFFMKDLCNRDEATSIVSIPSTGSADLVEKFRQKFIKEAQNISKLNHPNIIKVLDVFEENGTAYYVMEYINGGSLADLIKQKGSLSESETLFYTKKVASALQYIHSMHMNHLDVKPANVLLRQDGDVVLIDFGLSKNYDNTGEQTTSTPIGVSVGYAPIEQSRVGGVGIFSPATDIYSLGATMFKMITGQTPPEASATFDDGLPDFPSNISEETKHCIEKAMQPRRRDRFQTIEEFLNSLDKDGCESENSVNPPLNLDKMGYEHTGEKAHINGPTHQLEKSSNDLGKNEPKAICTKEDDTENTLLQTAEIGSKNLMPNADLDKEEECTLLLKDNTTHDFTDIFEDSTLEYVDLGLSVKWCTKNIGSTSPEDYGDFYAWGDSDGSIQSRMPKKFLGNIIRIPNNIAASDYDICRTQLGEGYRMPSYKEWKELIMKCVWTKSVYNGVKGFVVKGPSGLSIFLPASGRKHAGEISVRNERGSYWSATRRGNTEYVYHISFDQNEIGLYCNPYYQYRSIRAVYNDKNEISSAVNNTKIIEVPCSEKTVEESSKTNNNEKKASKSVPFDIVDLGLSVYWCKHNFGAINPNDVGLFYNSEIHNRVGNQIPEGYRIPTKEEWNELIEKCERECTNDGCVKFHGKNKQILTVPMCGRLYDGEIDQQYETGFYWAAQNKIENKLWFTRITNKDASGNNIIAHTKTNIAMTIRLVQDK